ELDLLAHRGLALALAFDLADHRDRLRAERADHRLGVGPGQLAHLEVELGLLDRLEQRLLLALELGARPDRPAPARLVTLLLAYRGRRRAGAEQRVHRR